MRRDSRDYSLRSKDKPEKRLMDTLLQDLRYGFRQLAKHPGFSTIAVLTLALGIGANTAVFSVIYAVLVRPLPYQNSDRLVRVYDANPERGEMHGTFSPQDFEDLKTSQTVFQDFAAFSAVGIGTLTAIGEPHELTVTYVSGDFFATLGMGAELGRVVLPRDDVKGQDQVLV